MELTKKQIEGLLDCAIKNMKEPLSKYHEKDLKKTKQAVNRYIKLLKHLLKEYE